MSRSTVMTLIRYSIVIELLALFLFFWLEPWESGFVPVCITMMFCGGCFAFGLLRLIRDEENPLEKKRAAVVLAVYAGVCLLAVLARWLVYAVK